MRKNSSAVRLATFALAAGILSVAAPAPASANQLTENMSYVSVVGDIPDTHTELLPLLPSPGKGCKWISVTSPGVDIFTRKGGYLFEAPGGAKIGFEKCNGKGWVRVQYKDQIGWVYNQTFSVKGTKLVRVYPKGEYRNERGCSCNQTMCNAC